MPIKERIDDILRIRHKKAKIIQGQLERIRQAKEAAEKVSGIKACVLENGQLKAGSPLADLFANNPDAMIALQNLSEASFVQSANKLIEDYEALYKRFSREYINIAVVGTARQGKSQFIQSITGLDSRCVPAFAGDHCTGASSIIKNSEQHVSVEVELTYKTERELRDEAQSYLDIITDGQFMLGNIDELKTIDKAQITHYLNANMHRHAELTNLSNTFISRFVDHYDEWRGLIGKSKEVKHDENEIMTYVAQHNGKEKEDPDRINFFKFVAVKKAVIKKRFLNPDAGTIQLIDTEGLGANTTDTNDNMIQTIREESDAVIFMKRPEGNTGGSPTAEEGAVFDMVNSSFSDKGIKYWLAFLLNRTLASENGKIPYNETMCRDYLNYMQGHNPSGSQPLPLTHAGIADVSVRSRESALWKHPEDAIDGAEDFLMPFLTKFSLNLEKIDNLYIDSARKDAEAAYAEYELLSEQMKKIISAQVTGGTAANHVHRWSEEVYNEACGKLKKLVEAFAECRNNPCEEIHNKLSSITADMITSSTFLPPVEVLETYNGVKNPRDRLRDTLNAARNEITKQFIAVDVDLGEVIDAAKDQIATCLLDTGKLDMLMPELLEQNVRPFRRLEMIAQEKLDANLYPQLRSAIEDMANYELSIRGSLLYSVRSVLEEFSERNYNLGTNINFNVKTSQLAQQLHSGLWGYLGRMQGKLNAVIKDYDATPSKAIYALCDEFYDRVAYSQDVKLEWHDLYNDYQTLIWMDKLMAQASQTAALNTWKGYVEALDRCKGKTNFILEPIAVEPRKETNA